MLEFCKYSIFLLFPPLISSLLFFTIKYRIVTTSYAVSFYSHIIYIWIYMCVYIYIHTYLGLIMGLFSKMGCGIHTSLHLLSPLENTSWINFKSTHVVLYQSILWLHKSPGPWCTIIYSTMTVCFQCFVVKMNSKINSFPSGYVHACGCFSLNFIDPQEWDC